MRFQAVERVSVVDSERVLAVLEQQLRRRVGGDVEREGARIVLSGLGPSPRTINPRDTTVIEVRVEGGATLIDADVSFQASALAAPVGQEEIVRNKLQRVLQATRQQLEEEQDWLESERRERAEEAQSASGGSSSSARIYTGPVRADVQRAGQQRASTSRLTEHAGSSMQRPTQSIAQSDALEAALEAAQNAAPQKIEAPRPAASGTVQERRLTTAEAAPAPAVEVKEKALPEVKGGDAVAAEVHHAAMGQMPKPESATTSSQQIRARGEANLFAGARSVEREPEPNRPWMRWAAVAACVAAMVPFAWRLHPKAEPAPVIDLTQSVTKPATVAAESGPEGALRQWELALGSTDATSQTAYYAVPVDQYMWKRNVNRRDLQAMKEQEIARRRGVWTVKVEDVAIQRRDGVADVTLVKHITEQPQGGGRARERIVRTQLTLKNTLGIWWITSERDLYPKKAAADDEDNFNADEGETPEWAKPSPTSAATNATPSSASTN